MSAMGVFWGEQLGVAIFAPAGRIIVGILPASLMNRITFFACARALCTAMMQKSNKNTDRFISISPFQN
jgi:hypothetical protein